MLLEDLIYIGILLFVIVAMFVMDDRYHKNQQKLADKRKKETEEILALAEKVGSETTDQSNVIRVPFRR